MVFYQLDYLVDEVLKSLPSEEQAFLKKYLSRDFPQKEAKYLLERIVDHKWYIGERLQRDVGFRVAAIDYLENFYTPRPIFGRKTRESNFFGKIFRPASSALRRYFLQKSKILHQ